MIDEITDSDRLAKEQWREEMTKALAERGTDSIFAFAKRHPGKSLSDLAAALGGIAPVLVQKCYEDEARRAENPREFVKDLLIRRLLALESGWPQGSEWEDQNAVRYQLIEWAGCLQSALYEPALKAILNYLLAAKDIPAGWIPEGEDDPLIAGLFARYWPRPP
jgi:hypothetical protein